MLSAPGLNRKTPPPKAAHPLCRMLRDLRLSRRRSLQQVEMDHPWLRAIVLGSYERGDRMPPLDKLDAIFRIYGYRLAAVPVSDKATLTDKNMIDTLRNIADQLAEREHVEPDGADDERIGDS